MKHNKKKNKEAIEMPSEVPSEMAPEIIETGLSEPLHEAAPENIPEMVETGPSAPEATTKKLPLSILNAPLICQSGYQEQRGKCRKVVSG